ncbi:MAG TPA: methionine synthase [Candidatus Binatia bacterium]|nr:methionine synthase [Candidatus Binatia bacterium]
MTRIATTIAGSLPKPAWLAQTERLWPQWLLEGTALEEAKRDATELAVAEQVRAGLDVVTDGEQSRRHFVHGFLESLEGIDFTKIVRKGIRADRYQADLPTITGPVSRTRPVHVAEARFARGLTDRELKITIPGPMTIVDTLHDVYYGDRKKAAFAFASAIRAEIEELAEVGVDVVQLDEPAFNVYFQELEDWGIDALDACVRGVSCSTAVHVCYGYGIKANIDWKHDLGPEWDQYAVVLPLLAQSTLDEISIELAGSRVPPDVLGSTGDKRVAVGVIDVATDEVETPYDVQLTLATALRYVPAERLLASTNCGMAPMKREIAKRKLRSLAEGAQLAGE